MKVLTVAQGFNSCLPHQICEPTQRAAVESSSGLFRRSPGNWKPLGIPSGIRDEAAVEEATTMPSVHFIGIGGAGLSALASLALEQGWKVSGSDAKWNERLETLKAAGARVHVGHAAGQIIDVPQGSGIPDAVVVSSAVANNNEEVEAARAFGVPIYKRAEWLGKVTENYELIAIAGSHGKSTTTAMLGTVLRNLGDDVTVIVGAEVLQFPGGGNSIFGQGQRFVLEADEYDGCFLGVSPSLAVVTNVEWEHVDMFPNEAAVRDIFKKFVLRIKFGGTLVLCGDSGGSRMLAETYPAEESPESGSCPSANSEGLPQIVTYGLEEGNDWKAVKTLPNAQGGTDYVAVYKGRPMARVTLLLPGTHNVLNSLAVIVVVAITASQSINAGDEGGKIQAMQEAAEAAGKILGDFIGVRRRFEFIGSAMGVHIYDDYAHHPTEVRAVLQAARQRYNRHPIWVVFQPHTYSRLSKLLHNFAHAFNLADRVIITEIYAAREDNVWNISGADLASALVGPPAIYIPKLDDVVKRLSRDAIAFNSLEGNQQRRIVILTLGAGDITTLGPELIKVFSYI